MADVVPFYPPGSRARRGVKAFAYDPATHVLTITKTDDSVVTADISSLVSSGPAGAVGATGATGATGPAGPAGSNATTTAVASQSTPGLESAADKTKLDSLAGSITLLGTYTIAESSLLTLALAVRRVSVSVPAAVTTGNYLAIPVSAVPAGYGLVDVICTTNGSLSFGMLVPILGVGSSYSIPVRVLKFTP